MLKKGLLFMKLCIYVYNFWKRITVYKCNILTQQGWYVLFNEQVDAHPNILTFYANGEYVYEFVEADGDWDC